MKTGEKTNRWGIVGLCFLMVFTCLGFCSSNKSIYLSAITEALGMERSAFSLSDSCRYVATAVVNLFFGTLVSRFGTKKLIGAGFLSLIVSCVLYAVAENLWVFYLGGVFLGIGLSWTTTTMVGWIVGMWCREKKGTIMGAVLAANGIGGAVAAQIVSPIIYQQNNAFGYRQAYWLVAGILGAVGVLILLLYREKKDGAEESEKSDGKAKKGDGWSGVEFEKVKKMPYFFLAAGCIFFTGMILQGVTGVAAAYMKDVGVDAAYVATVLSVHSLVLAGAKFLTGILYDKFGLRVTVFFCGGCAAAALILLMNVDASPAGQVMAMAYGVAASLALPLETVMLPIYAMDLFGEKAYNKTLGLFVSVNTAGYAVGAPIMNASFDLWRTYWPMFLASAVLMVLIVVGMHFVVGAARRQRKAVAEKVE